MWKIEWVDLERLKPAKHVLANAKPFWAEVGGDSTKIDSREAHLHASYIVTKIDLMSKISNRMRVEVEDFMFTILYN